MRTAFLIIAAAVLASCSRRDDSIADSAVATVAPDSPAAASVPPATPTAAPAGTTSTTGPAKTPEQAGLAAFAGQWSLPFVDASGTVLGTYQLNATADGTNWTLIPSGGQPASVSASLHGDSLLFDAGTYKAPGDGEVTTQGVGHLEGEKMVGTFVSRYAKPTKGDSVIRGRLRGTRNP